VEGKPVLRILLVMLLLGSHPAASRTWTEEKCARYGEAWAAAAQRHGTQGLSASFLTAHAAFLSSGCRVRAVCPRNPTDIAMADMMTILALNAGMSGTFLPFACRP
jgi:hypothetical protein